MIDLHCHMLPAIDDGAQNLETALKMAKMAVEDGITITACTPHIYPGLYENTAEGIRQAAISFQKELNKASIPLKITYGADVQIIPELLDGLKNGDIPTLHNSRYFLFEPPHHISPPGMIDLIHDVLASGYIPLITHPERLTYIEQEYDLFVEAAYKGAWIQLTAGSVTGRFGRHVQKVAERFLKDGITHLLATDAHNLGNRSPNLSEARDAAATLLGEEEANRLVTERPTSVINNDQPDTITPPPGLLPGAQKRQRNTSAQKSWFKKLFNKVD